MVLKEMDTKLLTDASSESYIRFLALLTDFCYAQPETPDI